MLEGAVLPVRQDDVARLRPARGHDHGWRPEGAALRMPATAAQIAARALLCAVEPMTPDLDLLAPAQVATLIAATVDRLRLAVSRSMRVAAGQVAASYGLDPQVGALIAMVRNIAPDREVTREDVSAIYVYQPPSTPQLAIAGAVEARLLDEPDDKRLCLTDRGRAMGPGPDRDAIETDTNRRAATPYRALSAAERLGLLAGLGSLNGQV